MHKSWPNGSAAWGLMFVGTLASANTGATHWQDHDDDDDEMMMMKVVVVVMMIMVRVL